MKEIENIRFTREDTKVAKAVAIVLMLAHHLFAFPERFPIGVEYIPLFAQNYEYILGVVGKLCVAMFVCLSGFGAYWASCAEKNNWKNNLKKIYRVYQKYWSVFVIFIPICAIVGIDRVEITIKAFIENITGYNPTYNGEWWFLTPFIVISMLAPILIRLLKKLELGSDIIFIILTSALYFQLIPDLTNISAVNFVMSNRCGEIILQTISFIPVFLMGAAFAKYCVFEWYMKITSKVYISIPIGTIIMIGAMYTRYRTGAEFDYILAPLFIMAAVGVIQQFPFIYRVAKEIGSVSTEIWLIHSFYCYHLIPRIIFLPQNSILVLIWLLALSYTSGKIIIWFVDCVVKTLKYIKEKQC